MQPGLPSNLFSLEYPEESQQALLNVTKYWSAKCHIPEGRNLQRAEALQLKESVRLLQTWNNEMIIVSGESDDLFLDETFHVQWNYERI
jgi:hypothetical protein